MAVWITIYCRTPVSTLSPEALLAGIRNADPNAPAGIDYATLAEGFDIEDEDEVDAALDALRVRPDRPDGLACAVWYRPEPDARPIVVHCWPEPERVAEEIQEAEENRSPPAAALARLRASREVVALELGYTQCEDMGLVIAYEIARWLAQKGDGIVADDDDAWLAVAGGGAWTDV